MRTLCNRYIRCSQLKPPKNEAKSLSCTTLHCEAPRPALGSLLLSEGCRQIEWTTLWYTYPGTTPLPTAVGRENDCQARRRGSTPAGQAKRTDTFLGETIGLRGVNIMVTSGPEISLQPTTEKMGSLEPLQVCQTTHSCPVNVHSNIL